VAHTEAVENFVERVPHGSPTEAAGWTLKADSNGFSFRIADASLANNARTIFQRYLTTQVDAGSSDVDGAELIFGELLGNVARHAPGAIDVRLPGGFAESQRGLFLVAAFGRDLRVQHHEGRTTTTVTLPVTRRRPTTGTKGAAAR